MANALSTLGAREPVPGYRYQMVLCSHFEYQICDCVHSYSILPCQTPFNLKRELSSENKAVVWPATYKNCVHTRTCTQAPAPCPNSSFCTSKKGVFSLVPSEYRTRAPSVNATCNLFQNAEQFQWDKDRKCTQGDFFNSPWLPYVFVDIFNLIFCLQTQRNKIWEIDLSGWGIFFGAFPFSK